MKVLKCRILGATKDDFCGQGIKSKTLCLTKKKPKTIFMPVLLHMLLARALCFICYTCAVYFYKLNLGMFTYKCIYVFYMKAYFT